jgi:hypothetical protein
MGEDWLANSTNQTLLHYEDIVISFLIVITTMISCAQSPIVIQLSVNPDNAIALGFN